MEYINLQKYSTLNSIIGNQLYIALQNILDEQITISCGLIQEAN